MLSDISFASMQIYCTGKMWSMICLTGAGRTIPEDTKSTADNQVLVSCPHGQIFPLTNEIRLVIQMDFSHLWID